MAKAANSAPGSALKGSNGAPIAIEMLPVDELVPYEKNAKAHPVSQIAKLAAGIAEYGFLIPNVIDKDNGIICGHGRTLAAKEAGLRIVPCIRAEHLSAAQIRAFRLFENRSAEDSTWIDAILKDELTALKELDFDLSLTGFSDKELQGFLVDDAELARAEETPDLPANPVTIKGDCWVLGGKHRVVCGDATIATDVDKALGGVKPHLLVSDPPYGVEYDANWRDEAAANGSLKRFAKNVGKGKVGNDDKADWRDAWALFPGEVAYVWHAGNKAHVVAESLTETGFDLRAQIIWAKHHFVIGRGHYHPHHEPCWYAVKGTGHWAGDRKQSALWQITHQKSDSGHSTQKPVECMRRPMMNNSSPGQAVYDPFLGSGTSVIAASMSGRICLGLELSEAYCDVIVQRFIDFSGEQAVLDGDGRTFEEIKQSRHGNQDKDAA